MKVKFFNPNHLDKNLKASVHKTGKLGFTVEAARKMSLSTDKSASIGINEDDPLDKSLYVMIRDGRRPESFNISKAGDYYYVNAKALFDNLKIDYVKDTVVYDITEEEYEEGALFKLRRREKSKKTNDTV
jgi:hypothetical protein